MVHGEPRLPQAAFSASASGAATADQVLDLTPSSLAARQVPRRSQERDFDADPLKRLHEGCIVHCSKPGALVFNLERANG